MASGNNFESHNHNGRNVNGQVNGGYVIQGDQHNHVHNNANEQPGLLGDLTASMASATHISNASLGPIWAKCDTDQAKLTSFSDDIEGRSLGDGAQAKMAAYGFCKINRGEFLKFVPPAPFFDRFFRNTTTYISVFHADENGKLTKNGGTSRVEANKSVIVTRDNTVRRTEMGYRWMDESGVDHSI